MQCLDRFWFGRSGMKGLQLNFGRIDQFWKMGPNKKTMFKKTLTGGDYA
jgi:hypothetical protein